MTTGQIVILSILSLGIFISWVINLFAEKESNRMVFSFCQIVLTMFIVMIAFLMTHEREKALKN